MDGLPEMSPLLTTPSRQRTIRAPIHCRGVGLHSGQQVVLTLRPAPVGHGVVFRRTDLEVDIPARYDLVQDTQLCTSLTHPEQPEARVGTIEHLMAAIAGLGLDNLLIEVNGPEVPILDGSSAPYVFLLECAGVETQDAWRPAIEILRTVRVEDGAAFAELRPGPFGFDMALSIDFAAPAIGRQALSLRLTDDSFRHELGSARTFVLMGDVARLQDAGLAKGGSLANAVIVDEDRVLNPGGLRMEDEFVRHKMLDAVGDLALAGAPLLGRFVGHRTGHRLNSRLLHALFADNSAWRWVEPGMASAPLEMPLQAAAAAARA